MKTQNYVGIHKDKNNGLTTVGKIIRDAWVFGLIPETETCAGWSYGRIEQLYDQVSKAWEPYGQLASNLPDDLRERHARIYAAAVQGAREQGWNPELDDED